MVETASKQGARTVEGADELRQALTAAVRAVCPGWLSSAADDLVQDAMIRLWQRGLLNEEDGEVSASYLWKVAHSVLVDEIRRRRRRSEIPLEEGMSVLSMVTTAPDPEHLHRAAELRETILDCLGKLLPDYRRSVILRILGHSIAEIARLLDWGPKKADNAIYRGLASLRRCLATRGARP